MSVVDRLLDAEGAIQTEARVPDLDGLLREAASEIETLAAVNAELLEALEAFVAKYVQIADSGDCGFWNPEEEDFVIAARAAIAKAKGGGHA